MTSRRIAVRVNDGDEAREALGVAIRLAQARGTEIVGIFVEDVRLLRWAASPFAREIGTVTAQPRPRDPAAMQRALRLLAEEARETFARRLAGTSVQWSFRVVSGGDPEALEALETELLFVKTPAGWRLIGD